MKEKKQMLISAEVDMSVLSNLSDYFEFHEVGWGKTNQVLTEDELIEYLVGKSVFLTSYDKVTRKVIEAHKDHLELIVCSRANPVNIDTVATKEYGIPVVYTPGRNSDVTAEFAVGLLLDVARNITFSNRLIMEKKIVTENAIPPKKDVTWGKVNDYHPYKMFKGPQIKNKNIGICGYGSIGRRVGKIMEGFGANILVYDPYIPQLEINTSTTRKVSFDELLKESDFISTHMKVTNDNTGLFNYDAFSKMKETAFFINNSRGAILVEKDLIKILRERRIAGAALDVFENEPLYQQHPFVTGELDNILVTPHISGSSEDVIVNGSLMIVDELKSFLNGDVILNKM